MKIVNFMKAFFIFMKMLWQNSYVKKMTRQQLLVWQEKRVQLHLKYLAKKSPYIQELSMKFGGVSSWKTKWPLMNKTILMNEFDHLNTLGIHLQDALDLAYASEENRDFNQKYLKGVGGDVSVGLSSGTSGLRGIFVTTLFERATYLASILPKAIPGWYKNKERVALLLRANNDLYTSSQVGKIEFAFFDLFSPFDKIVGDLVIFKPTVLIAPATVLRAIAEYEYESKIKAKIKFKELHRIFSVAEVLEQADRTIIEKNFSLPVHQIYQCTEGFLGMSCHLGTLHLNEDNVHFECEELPPTVDGRRRFTPIITDFTRTTQPIVRYRMNDILVESRTPCACGLPFMSIDQIEGRLDDVILLKERANKTKIRQIFPDILHRAMVQVNSKAISQYRIIQDSESEQGDLYIEILYNDIKEIERSGEKKEIEKEIVLSITRACDLCQVIYPAIYFYNKLQWTPSHNKLRRIMREKIVTPLT